MAPGKSGYRKLTRYQKRTGNDSFHLAGMGRSVLRPYRGRRGANHLGGWVISMAQIAAGRMYMEAR
jgi:hypothetical protein